MSTEETQLEKMFTVSQVCDMLHWTANTVRAKVKEGKLRAYKPGRQLLIPASAILELLEGSGSE